MNLIHKVRINISGKNGTKKTVLTGTSKRISQRLLTWLFGEFTEVLILAPSKSVECVEIHETKGGSHHEQ